MEPISQLYCANCFFKYDSYTRKPVSLPCGDSICIICSKKLTKCCVCFQLMNPNMSYTVNKPLMKIAKQKKGKTDMMVNILFIGSSEVGKSCLLRALSGQPFLEKIDSTNGIDFKYCCRQVKGLNFRYQVWDTARNLQFKDIPRSYYRNANIIVVAYDLSSKSLYNDVITWVQEAMQYSTQKVKFMIVGNKEDLINQAPTNRPIEKTNLQFIQKRYPHIEVSCKTNFGIDKLWEEIDQKALENAKETDQTQTTHSQERKNTQPVRISNLRDQALIISDRIKRKCF